MTHFTILKTDLAKLLWGRLEGIAPTIFWPRGRLPHGVGAYGAVKSLTKHLFILHKNKRTKSLPTNRIFSC